MNRSKITQELSTLDLINFPRSSLGFGLPNSLLLKWQSAGNDFHRKVPLVTEHDADIFVVWWLHDSAAKCTDADGLTAEYLLGLGPYYPLTDVEVTDRLPYDWLLRLFASERHFKSETFEVVLPSSLVLNGKDDLDFQNWIAILEQILEEHSALGYRLFERIADIVFETVPNLPGDGVVLPFRLFSLIYDGRPDLRAVFDIQSQDGFHAWVSWVLDQGVVEYRIVLNLILHWLQPKRLVQSNRFLGEPVLPQVVAQCVVGLKNELAFLHLNDSLESHDNAFDWWLRSSRSFKARAGVGELGAGIVRNLRDLWFHANFGVLKIGDSNDLPRHMRRFAETTPRVGAVFDLAHSKGRHDFRAWWEGGEYYAYPAFRLLHQEYLFAPSLAVPQDVDIPISNALIEASRPGIAIDYSTSRGRLHAFRTVINLWDSSQLKNLELDLTFWTGVIYNVEESLCRAARQLISNEQLPWSAGSHVAWWRLAQRAQTRRVEYHRLGLSIHPKIKRNVPGTDQTDIDVQIVGFPKAESGQGEDARTIYMSLQQSSAFRLDLFHTRRWLPTPNQAAGELGRVISSSLQPSAVRIFPLSAFDMLAEERFEGLEGFSGSYTIGYWPWELSRWPQRAPIPLLLVDEIWSSTRFIQRAVAAVTQKPVVLMPLPVVVDCAGLPGYDAVPQLRKDRFNFVFIFDGFSYYDRKNPLAVVRAFQCAFPDRTRGDVGLVIKAMNAEHFPVLAALKLFVEDDRRITLIYETWERPRLLQLIASADALVSLHRSEGFGRIMAEAMLLETPVIASDYSGNQDFCTSETAFLVGGDLIKVLSDQYIFWQEQEWFDPSVKQASVQMRAVYSDPDLTKAKVRAAYNFVSQHYSLDACGQRYMKRVMQIRETL